jgi:hypothetical protein
MHEIWKLITDTEKLMLFLLTEFMLLCSVISFLYVEYMGVWIILSWILERWDRVIQTTDHWYPMDRRLSGSQSRSGHCGDEKIFNSTGTRTPNLRSYSPQPAITLTPLSLLPMCESCVNYFTNVQGLK